MGRTIHSTAIISPEAAIGEDCSIGPYCVVGEDVTLGAGTRLHEHVSVDGHTTVGERCEIFPFASVGKRTQDLKYGGGTAYVEIGHDTTLREYVTVNAATAAGEKTIIGNHCNILAYCHIAHECILGDHVIMSNATQLAGHVIVEDHVVFGGIGGVHQFVRIGAMSMISATAKVVQDVLPFCLVDGNPAVPVTINKVGLERNGKSPEVIDIVQKAYRTIFRANLTIEAAVTQLREAYPDVEEVERIVRFAEASERGLARPKSGRR